jgi:opacity protein-like surface antigen
MRFASTLFVALLFAGTISTAQAQIPGFNVGIGGGPSLATGDFADVVDTGWHVQGLAELSIPFTPIGVRANVDYHRHSAAGGLNHNMLAGTVNGKVGIPIVPMIFSPYVTAGLGMYSTRWSQEVNLPGIDGEYFQETRTDIGLNAGVGMEVNLMLAKIFVETRLHNLFGDGPSSNIMPITFGLMF